MLSAGPIPPIPAHNVSLLLLQIGVLLGSAILLGRLAKRIGMPAIVGELCAGVLLGPSVLAHFGALDWLMPSQPGQMHMLDAVGMLGVLLLVGITGMNIDLGMVRRKGTTAAWVSAGGLLVPLALGVAAGFALPAALVAEGTDRAVFAWFIGVAMCVTAIPVIAKTLLEMRLMHRNVGQLIMSAAALDDIVGWLLLSVVSALATTGMRTGNVVMSVGFVLLTILFMATAGRKIVNASLRVAARSPEPGVTVAAVVLLVVLASAGTQALGMEAVVGAFLVGILIGASGLLNKEKIAPLRTFVMAVLAPLFFATAGLRMDLTALWRPEIMVSAIVVLSLAIIGKFAGVYAGARIGRLGRWESLAIGAGMNSRGVIEVIIAMVGLRLGVLTTEMYTIIVLVAIATSLMAPPMLRFAVRRMGRTTTEEREREQSLIAL